MCGRFFLEASLDEIETLLGPLVGPHVGPQVEKLRLEPRYNISPEQPVAVVYAASPQQRNIDLMRWGLVPGWSKGPDRRFTMINARAETVAEKPAYRNALRYRRCVLPASGFYEWRAAGKGPKQPFVIRRQDRQLLLLAGLWEHWSDPHGNELLSTSIIVTQANQAVAQVHERMPVILEGEALQTWMDPGIQKPDRLQPLLRPCAPHQLELYPVSRAVSDPTRDGVGLIAAEREQSLF